MKQKITIIKKLRARRYTYKEIGEKLGISKQRVHQLYKDYIFCNYSVNRKFSRENISCSICGGKKQLETHHKDGDRRNNKLSNLQRLCVICHRKEESFLYKNGLKPTERNRGKFLACEQCGEKIWVSISRMKLGGGRFCSRKCLGRSQRVDKEIKRANTNRRLRNRYKNDKKYREKRKKLVLKYILNNKK